MSVYSPSVISANIDLCSNALDRLARAKGLFGYFSILASVDAHLTDTSEQHLDENLLPKYQRLKDQFLKITRQLDADKICRSYQVLQGRRDSTIGSASYNQILPGIKDFCRKMLIEKSADPAILDSDWFLLQGDLRRNN